MSDKASTSDSTPHREPGRDPEPSQQKEPGAQQEFRLTRTWVIVGVLAILLGVGAGIVMSSSWLR